MSLSGFRFVVFKWLSLDFFSFVMSSLMSVKLSIFNWSGSSTSLDIKLNCQPSIFFSKQIVIRRLPPSLTKEELEEQLQPLPDLDYIEFFSNDTRSDLIVVQTFNECPDVIIVKFLLRQIVSWGSSPEPPKIFRQLSSLQFDLFNVGCRC